MKLFVDFLSAFVAIYLIGLCLSILLITTKAWRREVYPWVEAETEKEPEIGFLSAEVFYNIFNLLTAVLWPYVLYTAVGEAVKKIREIRNTVRGKEQ